MAVAECVFYGALFLEKVTCARKRFFFKKKIGSILAFPLHWQDDFCSLDFTPILNDLRANGERQTSNLKPQFDVNVRGKRASWGLYVKFRRPGIPKITEKQVPKKTQLIQSPKNCDSLLFEI